MAVCAGAKTTSYGNGVFSDDEFESVAQEVVHPQLSDYEEFVKSHGITFYRKYIEVTKTSMHVSGALYSVESGLASGKPAHGQSSLKAFLVNVSLLNGSLSASGKVCTFS